MDVATLCPSCWAELSFVEQPFCALSGLPFTVDMGEGALDTSVLTRKPLYRQVRASLRYNGLLRHLLHRFKYSDALDLVPIFSHFMARAGKDILVPDAVLVAVPLHWRRYARRLFNPALLLAQALRTHVPLEVSPKVLRRVRFTKPQYGFSAKERKLNVKGAFMVPKAHANTIVGRPVVLVDDIMTSGATITACTQALLKAGARHVDVLVLARVVRE